MTIFSLLLATKQRSFQTHTLLVSDSDDVCASFFLFLVACYATVHPATSVGVVVVVNQRSQSEALAMKQNISLGLWKSNVE